MTGRIAVVPALIAGGLLAPLPAAAQERGAASAWASEAAGGTLGSLAGFGLGVLIVDDECGDDIECILTDVAAVVGLASAGSALGTVALGGAADTEPSLAGAAIGALAGAFAGLGMLKVVEEIDPRLDDGLAAAITFSLSQGMVAAIGSRIGAAVR